MANMRKRIARRGFDLDWEEARLHRRYKMLETAMVTAVMAGPDGTPLGGSALVELSFGGFSVRLDQAHPGLVKGQRLDVVLTAGSQTLFCRPALMYVAGGLAGFRFEHDQADELRFLARIVRMLKLGAALGEASGDDGREELDDEPRERGQTEIVVDERGLDIGFSAVRYQFDGVNYELAIDAGQLFTRHDVGPGGTRTEMRPTVRLDPLVTRDAGLLLLGFLNSRDEWAVQDFLSYLISQHPWQARKAG